MERANETNSYIDSSVGALVWVRRRNGSWWPGRILGPDELPGSHLLSPRTGTPVKLLGREDGSVDWYNIEKSRRVKAFRCGEFDECIRKAQSSSSGHSRKREKYARREDAILHALELEKKHAQDNQLPGRSTYMDQNCSQISDFGEDDLEDIDGIIPQSDFHGIDRDNPTDSAQPSLDSIFNFQENKNILAGEWEDDVAESIPRMRGLQDFGLRIASSRETVSNRIAGYECAVDANGAEDENKACVVRNSDTSSSMNPKSSVVFKRKKSSEFDLVENENGFKKRAQRWHVHQNSLKNGYIVDPKEKELDKLTHIVKDHSESKYLSCETEPEVWHLPQIESRLKLDALEYDKGCSSFPDHMKLNCSDGRSYLYSGSQREVKLSGTTFIDSLLQAGPMPRSSFFHGQGYIGGDHINSEMAHSMLMNESFSRPLPNFNIWQNYGHREEISDQLTNGFGSRGQLTGKKMDPAFEQYLETAMPSDMIPTYSFYNNRFDENLIFMKRGTYGDGEDSLLFYRSNMSNDAMKPPMNSFKPCLSLTVKEEERNLTGEDEADSLQPISGPSLSSPEAVEMNDSSTDRSKDKPIIESFSSFYHPYGIDECRDLQGTHCSTSSGGNVGTGAILNNRDPPAECVSTSERILSKWQAKGRRKDRVVRRNHWGSIPFDSQIESLGGALETDDISVGNDKCIRKSRHPFRVSSKFDGNGVMSDVSQMHLTYNKASKLRTGLESLPEGKTWIDVWIEVKDAPRFKGIMVSLMSALNGKPIVGYPIQVEVIKERYRDASCAKELSLQPVWTTGRRTAMQRVPRSCNSVIYQDYMLGSKDKLKEVMEKHRSRIHPRVKKRKKASKKQSLVPQKTRMLSSIAVQHCDNNLEPVASKVSGPLPVTCIPVSVVFSRIREVLYRGSNHTVSDSDNNF